VFHTQTCAFIYNFLCHAYVTCAHMRHFNMYEVPTTMLQYSASVVTFDHAVRQRTPCGDSSSTNLIVICSFFTYDFVVPNIEFKLELFFSFFSH
jgi:hypothetical protein